MFPEIKIGGFAVSTYWVSILFGVVAMAVINLLRCRRYEIKKGWSLVITLLVALGGIAGAKILFFLEQIGSTNPVVKVGEGFSSFCGSTAGFSACARENSWTTVRPRSS